MRKWALYWDKDISNGTERWTIRQGRKRYPRYKYLSIADNEDELKKLVLRLNQPYIVKERVELKTAFVDEALIRDYIEEQRISRFGGRTLPVQVEELRLRKYFLNFFIGELNLTNPVAWHSVHKKEWAEFLLSDRVPGSTSTKRDIIQIANRFVKWLHDKRPAEIPPLKFSPLSGSVLASIHAGREQREEVRERHHIPKEDWRKIRRKLRPEIREIAYLAYYYGLRRNEALGLKPGDVQVTHLAIARQKKNSTEYGILKGKNKRDVYHWFMRAEVAAEWAAVVVKCTLYPDTVTSWWRKLTVSMYKAGEIKHDYDFHDLRHSWVTRAMRKHAPVDVMHGAGHENIETTMGYLHDDRKKDNRVVRPKKKAS